jgi:type IV pilus assembly protein PilO
MSSTARKAIFFALLIGLAVVGYHFMIRPANKVLTASKQKVEGKLAKLADFQKATAKAQDKDLSKQRAQVDEAIAFFDSKLPPTSEIHKVLEQITVIAQREGLETKSIRTLNRKDTSGYVEQPLRMELQGNFNSFYSFLLELEKLPRIMKVRKLDLSKIKKSEGEIGADFVVSIFFQNRAA